MSWLRRRRRDQAGPVAAVTRTAIAATGTPARRRAIARPRTPGAEPIPGIWGDGELRPMSGRQLRRLHLPPHRATSDVLQVLYPWMADSGFGALGPLVGHNLLSGSAFCADPWEWYEHGLISNPNAIVFGEIGSRKSTLVKTMIARGHEFGRDAFVTDVKSEYSDLAAHLGVDPIYLGPGLPARLNPFDPGHERDAADDVAERQLAMLTALSTAVLDRPLSQAELSLCKIAIAEVTDATLQPTASTGANTTDTAAALLQPGRRPRVPLLPEVIDAMLHPTPRLVDALPVDRGELREKTADLIMGLQRLLDGDLRGMFDTHTNIDVGPDSRFIVVNLSKIMEMRRSALPLVRICATSWLHSALARHDGRRRYVIADEAWADLTLGTLRWYQSMRKLSRQYLASNWLVFHQPIDILSGEHEALALSLIADTGTVILYKQKPQQLPLCAQYFGLNETEQHLLRDLRPGVALWKIQDHRTALVQHIRSSAEARFTHTDPHTDSEAGPPAGPQPDQHNAAGTGPALNGSRADAPGASDAPGAPRVADVPDAANPSAPAAAQRNP
ncbi:hypothetical protein [Nonomuraea sp. SYSU D8015]|uniref:hypothetical protein n=1 Tax=Nonomuraea sp. SYSU D8015 TaxID=2593644 RepID=UPI0016600C5F|nr:hypothetical protein [Nonomuraea sp. SYSU D8015]